MAIRPALTGSLILATAVEIVNRALVSSLWLFIHLGFEVIGGGALSKKSLVSEIVQRLSLWKWAAEQLIVQNIV